MLTNVIVLKTPFMTEVKEHLEAMGLVFVTEKHGNGPDHFACEINGRVLEIYPVGRDGLERVQILT